MDCLKLYLAILVTASLASALITGDDSSTSNPPTQARIRDRLDKLTDLFDFNRYKKLFSKKYESIVEEMARRTLFMGRVFRSIASAIKYKFYKKTSYLALNDMSDWTRSEREATHMRGNLRNIFKKVNNPRDETPKKTTPIHDITHKVESVRSMPTSELIKTDEPRLSQETEEKITNFVPSNNPAYEPPNMITFGSDKVEDTRQLDELVSKELAGQLRVDSNIYKEFAKSTIRQVAQTGQVESVSDSFDTQEVVHEDSVLVDHRDTNCFFSPRRQGRCGSCYIFNTIALIEWKYCRDTGKLVAFSEQYLIDCGHRQKLRGCEGGRESDVIDFVSKYGLELRRRYPYTGYHEECPHEDSIEPARMGYLKAHALDWDLVMAEDFELTLQTEPILVAIAVGEQFPDYGGGVDQGIGCKESSMHSMLLVGAGREDGIDYWLFRNSYGVRFGLGGYYKLDKGSKCMVEQVGIVLRGDFKNIHAQNVNDRYSEKSMRELYLKHLIKTFQIDA